MIKYSNECCDCATENYPCRGERCELRNVAHLICDECKDEDDIYEFDGEELCIHCIKKRLIKIEVD